MISYAGVTLSGESSADAALLAAQAVSLDPTHEAADAPFSWSLPDAEGVRRRVGVLSWPRGASYWASCCCLATDLQADAVRDACRRAAYAPQLLVLSDNTRSVTAAMSLLPPRPLAQCSPGTGAWLLDLVDARYFWPDAGAVVADVLASSAGSWAQLWAAVGAALGVTITPDPVPEEYGGAPPAGLLSWWDGDLPTLMDRAAAHAGMVVVRGLDGTLRVLSPESSLALHQSNLALTTRLAGGLLAVA